MYRPIYTNHVQYEAHPKFSAAIETGRDVAALPADITAMVDRARALRAATASKVPEIKHASVLIANGMDPDKAIDAEDASRRAVEQHRKAAEAAGAAVASLTTSIPGEVAKRADEIIETSIRARVAELVAEVRPHVEKLAEYGPKDKPRRNELGSKPIDVLTEYRGFDANEIIRSANASQLKAFQATIDAEATFAKIVTLYLRCLQHGDGQGYEINSVPRYIGGDAVWANPGAVPFDAIRGQATADENRGAWPTPLSLLTVASQPKAAGFRLASLRELSDLLTARQQAASETARSNRTMPYVALGDSWHVVSNVLRNG